MVLHLLACQSIAAHDQRGAGGSPTAALILDERASSLHCHKCDELNRRFRSGAPSNHLEEAGVLLRTFDGEELASLPWLPNHALPHGDRLSASLVNARHPDIYSDVGCDDLQKRCKGSSRPLVLRSLSSPTMLLQPRGHSYSSTIAWPFRATAVTRRGFTGSGSARVRADPSPSVRRRSCLRRTRRKHPSAQRRTRSRSGKAAGPSNTANACGLTHGVGLTRLCSAP